MVNRMYFILNTILFFCGLFSTVCYDQFGGLWLKGVTSAWFVLIGLVNIIFARKSKVKTAGFPALMMIGLALCWIADIVLNIAFIPGALIFAIGHVFYFAAYCGLIKFRKSDLIPSVIIFILAAALVLFVPIFTFDPPVMQIIILFYALIISLMAGKAIANMRRSCSDRSLTGLIVVGSLLFFFSDLMLLLCYFAGAPQITDTLCLFTYYPGQYLLAHSLYRYTLKSGILLEICHDNK